MIEKVTTVKNPLTVIAIFAAIAEISGTLVLPFIAQQHQGVYIWFLMLFPLMLVSAFFLTLNFNHGVLYAPSDYRDEKNFLKSFGKQTPDDRIKRFAEVVSDASAPTEIQSTKAPEQFNTSSVNDPQISVSIKKRHSDILARYVLAEQLVMSKLSSDFQTPIERDINFSPKGIGTSIGSMKVSFDGVAVRGDSVTAIEVKYFPTGKIHTDSLRKILSVTEGVAQSLKDQDRKFQLVLAVVTENDAQVVPTTIRESIAELSKNYCYSIDVRVYRFDELESSLGLD